jgi:tight adherence protein B
MNDGLFFLILIALAIAASGYGLVQIVLAVSSSEKRRIRQRLSVDWRKELASDLGRLNIQKKELTAPGFLLNLPLLGRLNDRLRLAFPGTTLVQFLTLTFALTAGAFLVAMWLSENLLWGVCAAVLGLAAPFLFLNYKRNRRQRILNDQLCDALDFLARILRAGHSLSTGFQMMGTELPEPIAAEFRTCYDQHTLGQPIEQVMIDMARRVDSPDFSFFVTSVIIQRQTGGDLAELLDNIGNVVRARIRLHQRVKALTAEGRLTGVILSILPPAMFFVLYFLNPDYAGLLINTPPGRLALGVMVTLMIVGQVLIRKIIAIKL